MQRLTALVITLIATAGVLVTGAGLGLGNPAATAEEIVPALTINGADAEVGAMIEDAVARYERLGLQLPPLEINVHAKDREHCHGHRAYWDHHDHHDVIDLCFFDQFTVLHELAHAFEHHNLDEHTRDEFMALTPGQVWRDDDVKYNHQGIEDAANTIARGLLDETVDPDSEKDQADLNAFELLVGIPSPRIAT